MSPTSASPAGNLEFEREPLVPPGHTVLWVVFAGLVATPVWFLTLHPGFTVMVGGIILSLPFIRHVLSPVRVIFTPVKLIVTYPFWNHAMAYRDIESLELREETTPKSGIPYFAVLIHGRGMRSLRIFGFGDDEISIYGELHRRWNAAKARATPR